MQIKTTMSYHFTPVRMAIIKKSTEREAACPPNGAPVLEQDSSRLEPKLRGVGGHSGEGAARCPAAWRHDPSYLSNQSATFPTGFGA